jgi:hypothetical protein
LLVANCGFSLMAGLLCQPNAAEKRTKSKIEF